MIRPLHLCHLTKHRTFKPRAILKEKLPMKWMANLRPWVFRLLFKWKNFVFGPDFKKYLQESKLLLHALLVLGNAPTGDDILD